MKDPYSIQGTFDNGMRNSEQTSKQNGMKEFN